MLSHIPNLKEVFKLTLPFPPSVNGLYGGGSKQQRFPSKALKAWWLNCVKFEPLMLDKVYIEYGFYFPDMRERDTQNYVKAVTDYMVKQGVIANDSWQNIMCEVLLPLGLCRENPRVEINIFIAID